MNAIQVETDPQNTHMLLGGLLLCVQDAAFFEENGDAAMDIRYSSPTASDTNLLSSGVYKLEPVVHSLRVNENCLAKTTVLFFRSIFCC